MCVAVRYTINGDFKISTIGIAGQMLPVLERGHVRWYLWGQQGGEQLVGRERPGHIRQFPAGYHVERTAVRNLSTGEWWHFKPRPVKVAVSAFMVFRDRDGYAEDRWVELKPGEFLQGAKCQLYGAERVYIVVEDAMPANQPGVRPPWPRIVTARPRSPLAGSGREGRAGRAGG